jgi:hypothetical protein
MSKKYYGHKKEENQDKIKIKRTECNGGRRRR